MKFRKFLHIAMLFVAMISGYTVSHAATQIDKENQLLLQRLDSIITNQSELVKEKEIRISGLRQSLAKANDSRERLGLSKQLYDEYIVFDSDSALYYAKESGKLTPK